MRQIHKRRKEFLSQADPIEDIELWQSELGRYIEDEADESVSVDELRQALSAIPGSMAAEISAERDER